MRAGDGNVSSNMSVGTVIVAQMGGGGGGVQETVKLEYTSYRCTKGCYAVA